jgi:hypothetical protein
VQGTINDKNEQVQTYATKQKKKRREQERKKRRNGNKKNYEIL